MTYLQQAKDNGLLFEQMLYDSIQQYFPDFVIRREKDVKDDYGNDITAIDIEIYKNLKVKDLKKERNIHIFIQAKWKDNAEPIKSINHFIKCCDEIKNMKKIDENDIYCIYATKVDVSITSKEALSKLTNGENIYCDDMERCVYTVSKRIADIFGKKIPKFVNKIEVQQLMQSTNYDDMKKANLITLVINLYGYKKSHATKFKHAELVKILINKNDDNNIKENEGDVVKILINKNDDNNIKENDDEVVNNKIDNNTHIVKVEYNEPNIRSSNEVKSKLLKKDSKLYNHLIKLKEILKQNGFDHQDRMDLHTEVLNDNKESTEEFIKRVNILEGKDIDIKNPENYDIIGRAIVLLLGDLEGYNKDAKITIAFIDNNKIKDAMKCLLDNI